MKKYYIFAILSMILIIKSIKWLSMLIVAVAHVTGKI